MLSVALRPSHPIFRVTRHLSFLQPLTEFERSSLTHLSFAELLKLNRRRRKPGIDSQIRCPASPANQPVRHPPLTQLKRNWDARQRFSARIESA